jgi:hypothetical protein
MSLLPGDLDSLQPRTKLTNGHRSQIPVFRVIAAQGTMLIDPQPDFLNHCLLVPESAGRLQPSSQQGGTPRSKMSLGRAVQTLIQH